MSKFRSYFVSDLYFLKSSITDLLALNAESCVDEIAFDRFFERFQAVSILLSNRDFCDLIRKR